MRVHPFSLILAILAVPALAVAAPLAIDLTTEPKPPEACPYGPGTTANPQGRTITADQRSFFLDGKPWVPVVGEFHYARYPRAEWRDELLKMKAGGINTVSTYVFWIHHEEERDRWDWSGQRSLRDFLTLAQEVGLKALVRLGPWCHGEARNGGFPDWVQQSGTRLRTTDPAFLKLVEPLFKEEAKQMDGLLWKDGGPVIGVQLDNECDKADYLLALKEMARQAGIDVPFYVITGWQGGLPKENLLPLFGGYADGFWGGSREGYRKEFLFNEVRALSDLGAQLTTRNPANEQLIARFPYACVEIGGGMASAYDRRIHVDPHTVAALALAKLGSGNNLPGYYMYHGGTNPEGKLSWLNEDHPNRLPVKDYDFGAPLGANGQVREQYRLLREQHLFLQDFGAALARMPAFFPDQRPRDLHDFDTLRWSVRTDGRSGFLFFSNEQPYEPLPAHRDVQFALKTAAGPLLVPRQPITIPTGSYGILPVNLDGGGSVVLEYATAQVLCRVETGKTRVYFLAALPGIDPELMLRGGGPVTAARARMETVGGRTRVYRIDPGNAFATSVAGTDGSEVAFVVLTPEQGCQLSRAPFAGADRVMLSPGTVFADGTELRLQADDPRGLTVAFFPPVTAVKMGDATLPGVAEGIFARFDPALRPTDGPAVSVSLLKPAGPAATSLRGADETTWNDAATYRLDFPATAASRRVLLNFHYTGDAVRLYDGDTLVEDQYYNGEPFSVALWRPPPADLPNLRLKVLPFSDGLMDRLPEAARAEVNRAKAASTVDRVTVTAVEPSEVRLRPSP